MRGRIAAIVMALLLLLYLVFVFTYALRLLTIDLAVAKVMGIALIVLPLIGGWALGVELLFGVRADRLATTLEREGALPVDDLPKSPSGRVNREAADAEFPRYQAETEANPDSWRAWFRLGLAYDASGDRRRARWATRESIRLSRRR
ncbi:tetratricopeptide repeat protein [soil metagenome]